MFDLVLLLVTTVPISPSHFREKYTEAQRNYVNCLKSHRQ